MLRSKKRFASAAAFLLAAIAGLLSDRRLSAGELELQVVDKDSGQPIPVRMHLTDQRGRPRQAPNVPFWKDHFVFAGKIALELPPGQYRFDIERGPEYRPISGEFRIDRTASDSKLLEMSRFEHMKQHGWWSGELHIHRQLQDIELLMLAEDLHVAPVITWWNDKNQWAAKQPPESLLTRFDGDRFYHVMAGEDERAGGALLYFNLPEPLPLPGSRRDHPEYPSPVQFLRQAKSHENAHVDIEKPFWWDMPVWAATGMADSIGLANNHMQRTKMLDSEAWGKPRDRTLFPGAHGNALWSQHIYYALLDCGLRIPPSAGSASGVLDNPVGYNRVYVHCGEQLTYEKWWEGLRAGRVAVTNGPLMRPLVKGRLPGYVFRAADGQHVELDIGLSLSFRNCDRVDYLEIVKNGRVVHHVRLDEFARAAGRLPKVDFDQSGWMLVRAVANNPETYRFASTGPYYVEIGGQPRISRKSVQFFLDWVRERAARIDLADPRQREEVRQSHAAAEHYWRQLLETANAE